jgi:hypothetical protein
MSGKIRHRLPPRTLEEAKLSRRGDARMRYEPEEVTPRRLDQAAKFKCFAIRRTTTEARLPVQLRATSSQTKLRRPA